MEDTTPIRLILAMKIKNRIVEVIGELQNKFHENSHLENTKAKFYAPDVLDDLFAAREHLVIVKMIIFRANFGIQESIFMLAEIKGTLNDLGRINTFEGPRHRSGIQEPDKYVADISQNKVETCQEESRKEINRLQDVLDEYNTVSLVDMPTFIKEKYWAA